MTRTTAYFMVFASMCIMLAATPAASAGGVYNCHAYELKDDKWVCTDREVLLATDLFPGEVCIPQLLNGDPC